MSKADAKPEAQDLERTLDACMTADRPVLRRRLRRLRRQRRAGRTAWEALRHAVDQSRATREDRERRRPVPTYPAELPVVERREDLLAAIRDHQVVIVCGDTGSGKSTQLPKLCLELGRGAAGLIGHTQPRRIAARSIAARVAEELHTPLGETVGYKVRFSDRTGPDAYVKVLTDGMLLAEVQGDRDLNHYDTLIIDEAHERSLNIDFLLGYLKRLLPRRPDLKLIITSATIDPERFARFFDNAPIVHVSGRTYPVEVRYRPPGDDEDDRDEARLQAGVLDAVDELWREGPGDTLVFLSGEREIRDTAEALRKHHPPGVDILPLYARLSAQEQNRVFAPGGRPRIVLATNVAETSLTVPGIRYVVDTGTARISRYSVRSKVQRLPVEKISQASADQRAGRCGRVGPGVCIRLYSEADFEARPAFTDPEILRTNLASVILQMAHLGLGAVEAFPFVEPPTPRFINDGYRLLHELGAVDAHQRITPAGRQLAKLPVDPRLARMLLAARDHGCLAEVLVVVAALSIQDPRERPLDAQEKADAAQQVFIDPGSDFLTLLKLWDAYREQARRLSRSRLRTWCREHFLSPNRMREWHETHQQIRKQVLDMGLRPNEVEAEPDSVHRALLAGLLSHVATRGDNQEYLGARGLKLYVFPGSALFRKPLKWLMAAELWETSRLYARTVAAIRPEWIEPLAGHLVKRTYLEPRWDARRAQVVADEQVSLYGLIVVPRRKVHYGPIDPAAAREIFIRAALIAGEYRTDAPFFQHNRQLVAEIEKLEAKARRRDILIDEELLHRFYDRRLPADVYSGKGFEAWRRRAEAEDPKILFMRRADLMQHGAEAVTAERFPDTVEIDGVRLKLQYRLEPGHEDDGVTAVVPVAALNRLSPAPFEWLVPGLLEEKVAALIRTLPKSWRRRFVPVPDFAAACVAALPFREGLLIEGLSRELQRMTGAEVPANAWDPMRLPPHLNMGFRVVDERGRQLAFGRDLTALQDEYGERARQSFSKAARPALERSGLTRWDFDVLPESVALDGGAGLKGYPALVDEGESVALRVLDTPEAAAAATRAGLRRLFLFERPRSARFLRRQIPGLDTMCLHYASIGRCEALREDLVAAVLDRLLWFDRPMPRSRAEFEARLDAAERDLMETANAVAGPVAEALAQHHAARRRLGKINALAALEAAEDIQSQLQHLVYPGFVSQTPPEWLEHLPRYLKAVNVRLDRLEADPRRDRERQRRIAPLWRAWLERRANTDDNPELEAFRWQLEELRVSVFAQELKTALRVSVERLEAEWRHLAA